MTAVLHSGSYRLSDDERQDPNVDTEDQSVGYRQSQVSVDVEQEHPDQSSGMEPTTGLVQIFQEKEGSQSCSNEHESVYRVVALNDGL